MNVLAPSLHRESTDSLITTPEITVVPDLVHEIPDKHYPGATLSVIQGVSLLLSWFSEFPGMSKPPISHFTSLPSTTWELPTKL